MNFFKSAIPGYIIAIISIILNIYLFRESLIYRELTFLVHPVRPQIVKAGQSSEIRVYHKEELIISDISIAHIAIWNQGTLSIKPTNIYKQITIEIEGNLKILEAKILSQTRDIVDLKLENTKSDSGIISVNWRTLEEGDGGVIQIIYVGDQKARIELRGRIEDQREIANLEFPIQFKSPIDQYESIGSNILFLNMAVIFTLIYFILTELTLFIRGAFESKKSKILLYIRIIAFMSLLLALIYVDFFQSRPYPPFSF